MTTDKLREEFEAWAEKTFQRPIADIQILGVTSQWVAYRDAHASGYRAGLERAKDVCESKREVMTFKTNNVPPEVSGFNAAIHECAAAIQKEIEKCR